MKTEQLLWTAKDGWSAKPTRLDHVNVVLVFGEGEALERPEPVAELRRRYPGAPLFGCSTAGEIHDVHVHDGTLVATALELDKGSVRTEVVRLGDLGGSSFEAGRRLAAAFPAERLRHLFVLSDGTQVNGSELVRGLSSALPPRVAVTGGLSGDGARFQRTVVYAGDKAEPGVVAALGFYGYIRAGYGSLGGWDPFGPERLVTRSQGSVLHELDGRSALEIYKEYLGEEHAKGLPASALLFPLSLRGVNGDPGVVRTILGVDAASGAMTFAGDIPQGTYVRFMKANFDRLIDGAQGAAKTASLVGDSELAILISCVGRKLILQERIEQEVAAARKALGDRATLTGFYSYGEISPFTLSARCELHNQTMTITSLTEA